MIPVSCPEPVKLVRSTCLAVPPRGDAPHVVPAALRLLVPLVPLHREGS